MHEFGGVSLDRLVKDDRGSPLPFEGIHWFISHKEAYAAGVVAPASVGIDIEKIRPCGRAFCCKTRTDEEWALGGKMPDDLTSGHRLMTNIP